MFSQMFFIRSDIKYQILNVKINFAPNIETIKIKPGFFPDNVCTYLTIYSLENIIDIYVQTPNMLAFLCFHESYSNSNSSWHGSQLFHT